MEVKMGECGLLLNPFQETAAGPGCLSLHLALEPWLALIAAVEAGHDPFFAVLGHPGNGIGLRFTDGFHGGGNKTPAKLRIIERRGGFDGWSIAGKP
jgi:hypothetical protein